MEIFWLLFQLNHVINFLFSSGCVDVRNFLFCTEFVVRAVKNLFLFAHIVDTVDFDNLYSLLTWELDAPSSNFVIMSILSERLTAFPFVAMFSFLVTFNRHRKLMGINYTN